MKTLYMMRHGETLFNKRRKIQGWCDSSLIELGIRQAKGAKKYFQDQGITFDHVYSSPSERCVDTLNIITDMPYKTYKGLKEMNFGTFEEESEDLNPPTEMYETFFTTYGGESRDDVKKRIYKTCLDIMNEENETVLIVSHGGACSHFLGQVIDNDLYQQIKSQGFKNCSILKYTFEDGKFTFVDIMRPLPIEE